jgi:hypothetical protein
MRIASWSIAAVLALAPVCLAQSAPQRLPPATTSGIGFSGAPYSGKQTTINEKTLTDGTRTTETFVTYLWRDAEGRMRWEKVEHTNTGAEYRQFIITDPVAGIYLKWAIGLDSAGKQMHIWPNAPRITAPVPTKVPPPKPGIALSTPDRRLEVLAPQEINGVYAEGTFSTFIIHMNEESSQRVLEVTNEKWDSPDLRITLRHIHKDPRGNWSTEITDVVRGDPDPALFQPPAVYQIVDHRPQNRTVTQQ